MSKKQHAIGHANNTRTILAVLPAADYDERDRAIALEYPEVFTTRTSRMACSQAELDYLTGGTSPEEGE